MNAKKQLCDFSEELLLYNNGFNYIAGVDEVGRGPLAGPVMAAAVILPLNVSCSWVDLINDSKKLSEKKREMLYDYIKENAVATAVGAVSPAAIDTYGIGKASRIAMQLAINQLKVPPDFLLIDAVKIDDVDIPQKSIVRGDGRCKSIAAASIVAKVTRDHYMMGIDCVYSEYGFARHKGYPTAEHMSRMIQFGICPIHRRSFTPVRNVINGNRL